MPTYAIQAPDGQTYHIDGPAGATDEQVRAEVLRQHPDAGSAAKPQPRKPSTVMDVIKGAASGFTKGGVAQVADTVASFVPGVNMIERLTTGGNPMAFDPLHPVGNLFQRTVAAPASYTPQTPQGRVAQRVAPYALAAALPGSVAARVANVFAPAVGSELAGAAADQMGASPQVVAGARALGGMAGGAASSVRLGSGVPRTADEQVANIFAKRAAANPEAMAQQAAQMRASGVSPTLVDVTGSQGQRLTKAVGITNPDAGETLQTNAQAVSSTTKPAAMARTRGLTGEARTSDQLASDLDNARTTEARSTYEEPYAAKVDLTDRNVIQALRDPEGASAINRAITAARARMDYKAVADLEALKVTANGPTGDGQVWPTTGRALDRVQIAFGNKGRMLAQNGANDIASGMFKRQDVINGLLDNVEGLQPARAAYAAKSQAIDILTKPGIRKDPFSTDPTDYSAWVQGLSPEARHANQVAIRQDILDTLGGQKAGTVGTLDELATSQYAKPNLQAALGDKEATGYLDNLTARLMQKRNASQVSPYAGSPTTMLQNDTKGLDQALSLADTAVKLKTGNVLGLAAKLSAHLKTMGMSDAQAQALARAAVDPSRVDGVIAAIGRLKGPQAAHSFVNFRGGLLGAVRGSAAPALTQQAPAPR